MASTISSVDGLDGRALQRVVSVAIRLQHLVVGHFVSTVHMAMAILDVVHGVGPADTELAAREVRDEGPPRNSHPRERVGRHCHDLEEALQMISMLQIHFGCPPRPAIDIHQQIH